jgi:hypothetical protein
MTDCQFVAGFASGAEIAQLQDWIAPQLHRFREAVGYGSFGPRCRHLDGVQIEQCLPELVAYGDERVRPAVEAFAGHPVVTASDRGRARRVQIFTDPRHGFRWHYDITPYAALLTVRNAGAAETQVVSARLSRWLRPAYYPLAWAPAVFSLLPHQRYAAAAGDMLIMRGDMLLHRGVALAEGERVLLVYAYEAPGQPTASLRARFAHYVNTRTGASQ